ncbi:MAG: hypothetical protein J6M39_04880 [Lachnospiraceae bacterium]|nr:hypothetical protein [Lachnospiraceae bacterium]
MISIPKNKIYNSYIIETYNYNEAKNQIKEFAISLGFEKAYVDTDNHPDIYYLESDTSIKIDTVRRDIVESSIYAPKIANYKIYVIYDAIYLEVRSQDTLLKTLEEPPEYDIFFIVTSNASKLLETIHSRCFIIKDSEENDYKKLLSLPYISDATNMLANFKSDTMYERMKFSEIFMKKENNLKDLISLYRYILRDAMVYKITYSKKLINIKELEEEITSIALTHSLEELGKLVDNLNKLIEANNNYINKKIAVFNFFEV